MAKVQREFKLKCLTATIVFLVCHLLRSGVAALFGPQSGTTSSHVQSICDAMEIPHIETRWDYRLKRDDYSVNLYPHPTALSSVSSIRILHMNKNYTLSRWLSKDDKKQSDLLSTKVHIQEALQEFIGQQCHTKLRRGSKYSSWWKW